MRLHEVAVFTETAQTNTAHIYKCSSSWTSLKIPPCLAPNLFLEKLMSELEALPPAFLREQP